MMSGFGRTSAGRLLFRIEEINLLSRIDFARRNFNKKGHVQWVSMSDSM